MTPFFLLVTFCLLINETIFMLLCFVTPTPVYTVHRLNEQNINPAWFVLCILDVCVRIREVDFVLVEERPVDRSPTNTFTKSPEGHSSLRGVVPDIVILRSFLS